MWQPKLKIEMSFRRSLLQLSKRIIEMAKDADDPDELLYILRTITSSPNFFPEYLDLCENAALKMVTHLYAENEKTWRAAAAKAGRGRELYNLLRREMHGRLGVIFHEQINRNAGIIKALPADIASDVTRYIARESLKGRRASEIAKEIISKFPAQTNARAKLIARTEVSKTQTAITEGRSRELGVNWYVWRATGGGAGDGRTREAHRKMNGVLVNWNDPPNPEKLFPSRTKTGRKIKPPPNPYHAGNIYNCRCYPEPVISPDFLQFPVKVFRAGRIEKMSRKKFETLDRIFQPGYN